MPEPDTHTDSRSIAAPFAVDSNPVFHLPEINMMSESLSTSGHESRPGYENFPNIARSGKPVEANAVFLIFMCCLLILSSVFVRSRQLITSAVKDIFASKSGNRIFYETTNNDFFSELFLVVQSVAVMSISLFAYFSHEKSIIEIPLANTLICIGFFCLLLIFYLLYKWIAYRIIINVFFDKSRGMFWTKDWSSLIFLSGLVMFLPAVFIYFVPHLYYFSFYVLVLWFFITRMIIIHKSYMIFFNRINSLHHLFLYLCAQEIVPLFLTYKSMVYVFDIVVDKGILWI